MSIITLTSDWGYSNYYAGSVKGTILSLVPNAVIVDITHGIRPFDINSTAFILKNCYHTFPAGTIHIVGVETEENKDCSHVAVFCDGQYFIGTDNGILSLALGDKEKEIYDIDIVQDTDSFTFSSRDRFAKVAAMIANGDQLSSIGRKKYSLKESFEIKPAFEENVIRGHVMFIDSYGNIITNISKKLFEDVGRGRSFTIRLSGNHYVIEKISSAYNDVKISEMVAIFGSHGYIEIALNHTHAASLCGIEIYNQILVTFDNTDFLQ